MSERDICTKFIIPAIQNASWDIQKQIREEKELRRAFVEVCRSEDMTVAQVVRRFVREYIKTAKNKIKTGQE